MHTLRVTHKFKYHTLTRVESNGVRFYETPSGTLVPSVTTILSSTKDPSHIVAWQQRVGVEAAEKIRNESARIGTGMHANLENAIFSRPLQGNYLEKTLANNIIKNGFAKLSEVWAVEAPLYSENLYAGTTDLVAVHMNGEPTIVDFKNSRNPKKSEWIDDYRAQLGAYALAHNEMYGTNIQQGMIMMACWTGDYQEFLFSGDDFVRCVELWIARLTKYLESCISSSS